MSNEHYSTKLLASRRVTSVCQTWRYKPLPATFRDKVKCKLLGTPERHMEASVSLPDCYLIKFINKNITVWGLGERRGMMQDYY